MKFIPGRRQTGTCGLSSMTQSLGCVHYKSMKILAKVIAVTRKGSINRQFLHFLEHKAIEFEFRGPIAMKCHKKKFRWYMLKLVDMLDAPKVTSMITNGETLSERLKWQAFGCTKFNFILLVRHIDPNNRLKVGDVHAYNMKLDEEVNVFAVYDEIN